MTFSIDLEVRPIKFAFLVDPNDKAAIMQVIETNSFLWGGTFNPIIPAYQRIPPIWKQRGVGDVTSLIMTSKELM